MRHALIILALAGLGGCVETVKFSAMAPNAASARQALAAEAALRHGQTRSSVETHPEMARRLSLCAAGETVDVYAVRVTDDGLCGSLLANGDAVKGQERCWRFDELTAVGKPRDATTFGYYPVRSYLKCSANQ